MALAWKDSHRSDPTERGVFEAQPAAVFLDNLPRPVDFEQFQKLVNELGNYWFTLVVLPPKAG